MALVELVGPGSTKCRLCGRLLTEQEYLCTSLAGVTTPDMRWLDDGCAHVECLKGWALRDQFVREYNAAYGSIMLAVSRDGRVHYAGPIESILIRCRLLSMTRHRPG